MKEKYTQNKHSAKRSVAQINVNFHNKHDVAWAEHATTHNSSTYFKEDEREKNTQKLRNVLKLVIFFTRFYGWHQNEKKLFDCSLPIHMYKRVQDNSNQINCFYDNESNHFKYLINQKMILYKTKRILSLHLRRKISQ